MRYIDSELFDINEYELYELKENYSFFDFCEWAIVRMQVLIEESTRLENWMDADIKHLRNYRIKAIDFYRVKGRHSVARKVR